jgi:hypothetical protein
MSRTATGRERVVYATRSLPIAVPFHQGYHAQPGASAAAPGRRT